MTPMNRQELPAERTISHVVNEAARRVGSGCLARRAAVARDVLTDVRHTAGLWHGPAVLRLVAEAERVLHAK